jgi:hypothetical protein
LWTTNVGLDNVVSPTAFAIHADLKPLGFQEPRELLAGELTPLVGVEDLGTAILRDRLPHGVETEVRGERIGEPPGQYPATRPVEHGEEIHKTPAHRNVRDISGPNLIGT